MSNEQHVLYECPHCGHGEGIVKIIQMHKKLECASCKKYIKMLGAQEYDELPKAMSCHEVSQDKLPNVVSPPECRHLYAVPYELEAGVLRYKDKACTPYIDWTSNIINANRLRVRRYYCFGCNKIFSVPSDASDE